MTKKAAPKIKSTFWFDIFLTNLLFHPIYVCAKNDIDFFEVPRTAMQKYMAPIKANSLVMIFNMSLIIILIYNAPDELPSVWLLDPGCSASLLPNSPGDQPLSRLCFYNPARSASRRNPPQYSLLFLNLPLSVFVLISSILPFIYLRICASGGACALAPGRRTIIMLNWSYLPKVYHNKYYKKSKCYLKQYVGICIIW
jgi:hypothetical protein